MGDFLKSFLKRLDNLREGRPVTSFARSCGIPQQTMANYCKGERVPSLEALCRICSTNVVSADWLLGFTDSRTGTAAPVTDTVSASRIAELEREVERLRAENGGLRYALDALGKGVASSRGRVPATAGAMGA